MKSNLIYVFPTGLLVHDGIIHPEVSVLVLTWFIRYLCFLYYHWGDSSVGGLFVPGSVIRPVVSGLLDTCTFIIEIY